MKREVRGCQPACPSLRKRIEKRETTERNNSGGEGGGVGDREYLIKSNQMAE
jgi:hypothetical protein